MDNRSNKQKIIDAIKGRGEALKPKEIASITGIGPETVRTTVRLMKHMGELTQPKYGVYELPESGSQLGAVDVSDVTRTHDVRYDVQVNPPEKVGEITYSKEG